MMATVSKYRMSFSVGGLMLNESLAIADAYKPGETWACTRERLLAEGASSLPKLASQTRALREVYDRIGHLSNEERHYLSAEADRAEQQAIVWLAVCRTYRFIYEFAVEGLCCAIRIEAGLVPFPDIFSACGPSRASRVM